MKALQLLTLVAFLSVLITGKVLQPHCGPKTKDIRFCDQGLDEQCRYSDEMCVDQRCQVDASLYENFKCTDLLPKMGDDLKRKLLHIIDPCDIMLCEAPLKCYRGNCV